MRVTLIHNPRAGEDDQPSVDELLKMIRAAGHAVTSHSSKDEHLDRALEDPGDLVAVSGGDGTVGAVALRLVGRGIPVAVLPLGTANNISTTLGLADKPIERLIHDWTAAARMPLDLGLLRGPWGTSRFIESVGVGLFGRAICELDARKDVAFGREENREEKLTSALKWMRERLPSFPAESLKISLDGRDFSGEFILLEAMNIQHIGPSLHLAPDADPSDGLLDIVLIDAMDRGKLGEYLANRLEGRAHPPRWTVYRCRHLELEWADSDLHIDDEVWPGGTSPPSHSAVHLDVYVEGRALEFLIHEPEA
jgi:diacylglycerol kinase family enzyme